MRAVFETGADLGFVEGDKVQGRIFETKRMPGIFLFSSLENTNLSLVCIKVN